jgi:ABC-2 type transport system permease protein/oleandomycin transport system permease protein
MSTGAATLDAPAVRHPYRLTRPFRDSLSAGSRNLIAYWRVPSLLVFSTIQPIIFVLMFRYVFGGVVGLSGLINVPYVDYLMPGIFVQTTVFGAIGTAIGLATDLQSGLLERFRSLPMSRSAVLAGRTLADLVRNIFVAALMVGVGYAVGFRANVGALGLLAAMLIVLLFGYALSWVFASVGLMTGNPETAQAAAFPVMAPLVFASSAFVPVSVMPGWLQAFAAHQPVSVTVAAVRALCIGGPTAMNVLEALAWSVGILAVFGPLAVLRYRRSA